MAPRISINKKKGKYHENKKRLLLILGIALCLSILFSAILMAAESNTAGDVNGDGTNGVHPTVNGYYQIADAAYRSFCHDILKHFQNK